MKEIVLNIYVVINENLIKEFLANSYELSGDDKTKIEFLKSKAKEDFNSAYHFDAPKDSKGNFMTYKKFSKLEKYDKQFLLFEEIFERFGVPEKPLVCVTPVVDGNIIA